MQAQELVGVPGEQWNLYRKKHIAEIQAVKNGDWDIIDRRTWPYPYIPECASQDTEILTLNGWKHFEELKNEDLVATRNSAGELEWQKPTKLVSSHYTGPMCHFKGLGVDLLVTPNHRILGRKVFREWNGDKKNAEGHEEFVLAANIPSRALTCRFEIPLTSTWKGKLPEFGTTVVLKAANENKDQHPKQYKVDLKDWVAFLGLYLAEGDSSGGHAGIVKHDSTVKTPIQIQAIAAAADRTPEYYLPSRDKSKGGQGYSVSIAQLPTSKDFSKMERFLLNFPVPFKWDKYSNRFSVYSKALWQTTAPLGNSHTKYIPQWVKNLPPEYLEVMLNWMVMGDGYKYGTGGKYIEYYTSSRKLADDVQEVAQKIGIAANVKQGTTTATTPGRGKSFFYTVRLLNRAWAGIGAGKEVPYDGLIWCVSVPNQTIFVRRNGKGIWTGNSLHRLNQPI